MFATPPIVSLVLGQALLVTAATSQRPAPVPVRQQILGKVQGRDGKPWVGAVVTLTGDTDLSRAGLEPVDHVEVTTGPRGRFRARLLSDRSYEAFAVLTTKAGPRVTNLVSEVVPGRAVELIEALAQPTPTTLEFPGLDAWKGRGIKLFVDSHELAPDAKGRVRLPVLAGGTAWIEGRIGRRLLFRHSTRPTRERSVHPKTASGPPRVGERSSPAIHVERVVVPRPLEVTVRVIDKASKKPVPGASVLTRDQGDAATVFTTGADGRARFVVAHPIDRFGRLDKRSGGERRRDRFFVVADGYELRRTGWGYGRGAARLTEASLEDGEAPELTVELEPGFRFTGTLIAPPGIDPRGIRVLYELQAIDESGGSSEVLRLGVRETRVQAGGTWTISGLCKRYTALAMQLCLPPALTAGLVAGRPEVPSIRRIPLRIKGQIELADDRAAKFDLRKLHAVDVALELDDGRKAGHASVAVMPIRGRAPIDLRIADRIRSDRRGRCRVFTIDADTVLVANTKTRYAFARLGAANRQKVTLSRCARFSGRVIDKNGEPLPGATVRFRSMTVGGSDLFQGYKLSWNQRSLSGTSDADGRFSLFWIPARGLSFRMQASVSTERQTVRSGTITLVEKSVEDVVLTLDVDAKVLDKRK